MIRALTDAHRQFIISPRDLASRQAVELLSRDYDACVVGSGPGGSVAAATLAEAGLNVILVERGPFRSPHEFNFQVLDMSARLGHLELTQGYRTALLQGNVLGGSSIIFGAVAMQPPAYVFDEWQEVSGVSSINPQALAPHYEHVGRVLSITAQTPAAENRSNAIVRQMAGALGKPDGLEILRRYTKGCAGMGLCNFGCGFDLKGTMLNSFLPVGLETGNLTILTECEAEALEGRSEPGGFRATHLRASARDFATGRLAQRLMIKARTFLLGAGAYFSSALLLRTDGLPGRSRIGAKIYLQPHAQVFALFDEPVTARGRFDDDRYLPQHGVPAIYNFTGFLREHRFFWLASILFPANLAAFVSDLAPEEHLAVMRRFHYTTSITLTIRDDPDRSRVVMRDGQARLDFRESRSDLESLRQAFVHAARGFLAVGARRVFLPLLRPPVIERIADLTRIERLKFDYSDVLLYSDHTSGGNGYGSSDTRAVTDPTGRLFGTRNIRVVDSSLFPSACGVNPSWTIMALSRHVSLQLASE
jgi:choline dehydrogenase-like flavoprotein